jgi:hypothetical protein
MKAVRRAVTALAATATLLLVTGTPVLAYEPVNIVHTEQVQAGPYRITLGFSQWPLRAMQSLDFSFIPDGGLAGKSGTLTAIGPGIKPSQETQPLVRHPRKRDIWGLDIEALDAPGTYTFGFRVNGPQGPGEGTSSPITVLEQPGPPLALSWAISALPLVFLITFLTVAWRRSSRRPAIHPSRLNRADETLGRDS